MFWDYIRSVVLFLIIKVIHDCSQVLFLVHCSLSLMQKNLVIHERYWCSTHVSLFSLLWGDIFGAPPTLFEDHEMKRQLDLLEDKYSFCTMLSYIREYFRENVIQKFPLSCFYNHTYWYTYTYLPSMRSINYIVNIVNTTKGSFHFSGNTNNSKNTYWQEIVPDIETAISKAYLITSNKCQTCQHCT